MTQANTPRTKEAQAIIRHNNSYKCFSRTYNAHTETLRLLTLYYVESVDSLKHYFVTTHSRRNLQEYQIYQNPQEEKTVQINIHIYLLVTDHNNIKTQFVSENTNKVIENKRRFE